MNELVKINENNQVTTDSLTVADRFGKRHCDVLRSIKMLKCSKDFNERNFASVEYLDQKGEKRTYYDITRDGWMFLVMGFTGEKAAEWKEKFIAAFNRMEAAVREIRTTPSLTQDRAALQAIGGIVKKCAAAAIKDAVLNVMTSAEQPQLFGEVSDNDLIRCLWNWYATHHKKTFNAIREITRENDELKCKLATIKKAVA